MKTSMELMTINYEYTCISDDFENCLGTFVHDLKNFLKAVSDIELLEIKILPNRNVEFIFKVEDSFDNYGSISLAYIFDDLGLIHRQFVYKNSNNKF